MRATAIEKHNHSHAVLLIPIALASFLSMDDYRLVNAAVDNVKNYLRAIDADPAEVEVSLQPYFDEEGDTVRIDYRASISQGEIELDHRIERSHEFHNSQDYELDYILWVEEFLQEFRGARINYMSAPLTGEMIDTSVENVKNFLQVIREEPENISILVEPDYDDELESWIIEYYVRPTELDVTSSMSMQEPLGETEEEFKAVYTLWIARFKEEFPESEMFYPEIEDIL